MRSFIIRLIACGIGAYIGVSVAQLQEKETKETRAYEKCSASMSIFSQHLTEVSNELKKRLDK